MSKPSFCAALDSACLNSDSARSSNFAASSFDGPEGSNPIAERNAVITAALATAQFLISSGFGIKRT
jgi:hypothetical protein